MNSLAYRLLARSVTKGQLALVAAVLFAPAVARASCGDYVTVGGGHGAYGVARPGQEPGHASESPGRPHRPCSGPSCTRAPSVPPAPVPPPPVQHRGDSACLI